MEQSNILAIDDDRNILKSLQLTLSLENCNVITTDSPGRYTTLITEEIDAVLLDLYIGSSSGKEILKELKTNHPLIPVIMISGLASYDEAIECIQAGAFDFIEKPIKPERLIVTVKNAVRFKKMRQDSIRGIMPVHRSQPMQSLIAMAAKIAPTGSTVLITGESGTGKDVLANFIHKLSLPGHNSRELVKINCGAIPENLIESELFGHVKGAYTGAISHYDGKLKSAEGGALFLDEVAELPLQAQVKLLRFLENGEIQRIGENRTLRIETRLIAATNRVLEELVENGNFRQDLYYRLNVIHLHIPPLRERTADILPLVYYFANLCANTHGIKAPEFTEEALRHLENLPWKGNVRELRNLVERIALLSTASIITVAEVKRLQTGKSAREENILEKTMDLAVAKRELEAAYILKQLEKHDHSIKETAEALNILPTNLCRRMRALGIQEK